MTMAIMLNSLSNGGDDHYKNLILKPKQQPIPTSIPTAIPFAVAPSSFVYLLYLHHQSLYLHLVEHPQRSTFRTKKPEQ